MGSRGRFCFCFALIIRRFAPALRRYIAPYSKNKIIVLEVRCLLLLKLPTEYDKVSPCKNNNLLLNCQRHKSCFGAAVSVEA